MLYYILPVVFDILKTNSEPKCTVIVVSPLVALMKDQVTLLMSKGVKGVYVTTCSEIIENVDKIHTYYASAHSFNVNVYNLSSSHNEMLSLFGEFAVCK